MFQTKAIFEGFSDLEEKYWVDFFNSRGLHLTAMIIRDSVVWTHFHCGQAFGVEINFNPGDTKKFESVVNGISKAIDFGGGA